MSDRSRTIEVIVSTCLLGGLLIFVGSRRNISEDFVGESVEQVGEPVAGGLDPRVVFTDNAQTPAGGAGASQVFRVGSGQVLASVNGRELTLADLIPLNPAQHEGEREISQETYEYFLDRAVNRELIVQTAKARGVELTESQREQLAKLKTIREQPEPGLVQKFNAGASQVQFELRDAEAFMLQTTLLAAAGASPNVTQEQVLDYFRTKASEFEELPTDTEAKQEAWERIDFQIRQQLASGTRSNFQSHLVAYMNRIRSAANIEVYAAPDSEIRH